MGVALPELKKVEISPAVHIRILSIQHLEEKLLEKALQLAHDLLIRADHGQIRQALGISLIEMCRASAITAFFFTKEPQEPGISPSIEHGYFFCLQDRKSWF